jgi:hypothetical protein
MTTATAPRTALRFRTVFPAWDGSRPLGWFFAEQLLEARAETCFPTSSRGYDEDVNVYLIGLLTAWATADPRGGVWPGADPLWLPPDRAVGRRESAEHYRRQADHRLLALGLFERGDLARRRRRAWRLTEAETTRRDLAVGIRCYELAANLLDGRCAAAEARIEVWRKLAAHLPDYVHILQTLARRRLGLGAQLSEIDLARLMMMTDV